MSDDKKSQELLSEEKQPAPKATFVIRVHFHRNATWQGTVTWLDTGKVQNFRSALELITLMDGALSEQTSLGVEGVDWLKLAEVEQAPQFTD